MYLKKNPEPFFLHSMNEDLCMICYVFTWNWYSTAEYFGFQSSSLELHNSGWISIDCLITPKDWIHERMRHSCCLPAILHTPKLSVSIVSMCFYLQVTASGKFHDWCASPKPWSLLWRFAMSNRILPVIRPQKTICTKCREKCKFLGGMNLMLQSSKKKNR